MSVNGEGEWKMFGNASFYGAPFIWTTLHDFGGTDGMKGEIDRINRIPFDGIPEFGGMNSSVWGTGYTPEGIDQNPVYYEFMAEANFREKPVENVVDHVIQRSHRRYGLKKHNRHVSEAWRLLMNGTYSDDLSVQDGTGVAHIPGWDTSHFYPNRITPKEKLCDTFSAWRNFIEAAESGDINPKLETFRYDLVNVGREILAQISTPMSNNFSDAIHSNPLDKDTLLRTGSLYIELLLDLDVLVSTDTAFLIGPWLSDAKRWAGNHTDCGDKTCEEFYNWNARSQLTTWNPVPAGATEYPDGPVDYAAKHWSGLVRDYYAVRVDIILDQALSDCSLKRPLNENLVNQRIAEYAYKWQNDNNLYPEKVVDEVVEISRKLHTKYSPIFESCKK